jgi:hypothetical protein
MKNNTLRIGLRTSLAIVISLVMLLSISIPALAGNSSDDSNSIKMTTISGEPVNTKQYDSKQDVYIQFGSKLQTGIWNIVVSEQGRDELGEGEQVVSDVRLFNLYEITKFSDATKLEAANYKVVAYFKSVSTDGEETSRASSFKIKLGNDGESDDGESDDGESDDGESDDGESDDGESDDGESDDGESDDGESDDGESDDGESDDGESDDGESDDGESDDGESDDGESDDGESDDGESDDGESDDGESDDGESDDGESDDGESDDGESDDGESDDGESDENNDSETEKRPRRDRTPRADKVVVVDVPEEEVSRAIPEVIVAATATVIEVVEAEEGPLALPYTGATSEGLIGLSLLLSSAGLHITRKKF